MRNNLIQFYSHDLTFSIQFFGFCRCCCGNGDRLVFAVFDPNDVSIDGKRVNIFQNSFPRRNMSKVMSSIS